MRYFIAVFLLLVCKTAFTQQWHPANKKLKQPKNTSGYYITVGYFNRYDSIPCTYVTHSSAQLQKGFKFVYVRHGHYIDDTHTFRIFYDENFKRINDVDRFYFK